MRFPKFVPVVCLSACSALACESTDPPESRAPLSTERLAELRAQHANSLLKEQFEGLFRVGAAVDSSSYQTHAPLLSHFNSLTTENEMKFESLQRTEGNFNFDTADAIVDFAVQNTMTVRGHALVWHRQTPSWVFVDAEGNPASEDLVLERMQKHIQTVMTHFAGRVTEWDVVNEAVMNDGRLRTHEEAADDQKSPWFGSLGEKYIARAFQMAHAADPNAKLYYNDYYNYLPEKQQGIYELLKRLLESGVVVHGVGMQCHLNIEPSPDPEHQSHQQTVENLESAILLYESLGLEVQVTELDLSLYVGGSQIQPEDFYTLQTFTTSLQLAQADRYAQFFDLFRRHARSISSVSFWGVADDNTWLSEFESGRTDFPLLFDVDHQPKPAFFGILDF